jgi:RNA polymerase sigma-B factor
VSDQISPVAVHDTIRTHTIRTDTTRTLDDADVAALLAEYQRTGDRRIRNRVVELHIPLATVVAAKYARSGTCSTDDLRQTALLAIMRAADRYDPAHGASFKTFARRTVEGELKRYLRDRTWSVRPPRSSQERYLRLQRVTEELQHRLGRTPTVSELASELDLTVDQVLEGLDFGRARNAHSLDRLVAAELQPWGDQSAVRMSIEERIEIRDAIAGLGEQARKIVVLRFFDDLSQPEIADRLGLSQSYVSRVLMRTVRVLQARLHQDTVDLR